MSRCWASWFLAEATCWLAEVIDWLSLARVWVRFATAASTCAWVPVPAARAARAAATAAFWAVVSLASWVLAVVSAACALSTPAWAEATARESFWRW